MSNARRKLLDAIDKDMALLLHHRVIYMVEFFGKDNPDEHLAYYCSNMKKANKIINHHKKTYEYCVRPLNKSEYAYICNDWVE